MLINQNHHHHHHSFFIGILFFLFLQPTWIKCSSSPDKNNNNEITINPWELPAVPSIEKLKAADDKKNQENKDYIPPTKFIPKNLWITMKEIPQYSELDYNVRGVIEINQDWEIHLTDDYAMNKFMNETFANTSLLWAFHMINPKLGASKADIWRVAVLWRYGGVYIDADSHIYTPLSQAIQSNDEVIIGTEAHAYVNIYHQDFPLSKVLPSETFGNHNILQWLLMSAPFHPFFTRILENIVLAVKTQFLKKPVFIDSYGALGETRLLATTGPLMVSASVYQVLAENPPGLSYRWAGKDYGMYHAVFKAFRMPANTDSYIFKIRQGEDLLVDYYHSPR